MRPRKGRTRAPTSCKGPFGDDRAPQGHRHPLRGPRGPRASGGGDGHPSACAPRSPDSRRPHGAGPQADGSSGPQRRPAPPPRSEGGPGRGSRGAGVPGPRRADAGGGHGRGPLEATGEKTAEFYGFEIKPVQRVHWAPRLLSTNGQGPTPAAGFRLFAVGAGGPTSRPVGSKGGRS